MLVPKLPAHQDQSKQLLKCKVQECQERQKKICDRTSHERKPFQLGAQASEVVVQLATKIKQQKSENIGKIAVSLELPPSAFHLYSRNLVGGGGANFLKTV